METVNIKTHRRGDELGSNYALRGTPLNLSAVHIPVLHAEGVDRFEDDGGAIPQPVVLTGAERYRTQVRIRVLEALQTPSGLPLLGRLLPLSPVD